MQGFCNRVRSWRGISVLVLSVTLCISVVFSILSCNDEDKVSNDMYGEPMKKKGYFLTIDETGKTECTIEQIHLREAEGIREGETKVQMAVDFNSPFESYLHEGVKVTRDGDGITLVTHYAGVDALSPFRPGAYFFKDRSDKYKITRTNGDIATVYVGFWTVASWNYVDEEVLVCSYVFTEEDTNLLPDDESEKSILCETGNGDVTVNVSLNKLFYL